ncbi:MAG: hypothetical protein AB203_02510 [Parcubacteria bacterium C7867-008]|nr:MAG: hypothetical protein AB203_02510 [Parcubacteria bacterium C7867-008]
MSQEEKIAREIWLVIERLKEDYLLTPEDQYVTYEVAHEHPNQTYPSAQNQIKIIKKLGHEKALRVVRENYITRRGSIVDSPGLGMFNDIDPKGFLVDILFPKFDEMYSEYSQYSSEPAIAQKETNEFSISIQDRNVYINKYLLSRPHGAGKNLGFLEYVFERSGQRIEREKLPEMMKTELGKESFSKVLYALGFTGEILKAFFPERAHSTLTFRKTVSIAELQKSGVDIEILEHDLKGAHIRNSRK